MNWMTSAKNRIQCSKSKRNNDLRMIASSKLSSASSNFFSCREKESNQDIIPFAFTLQSKDSKYGKYMYYRTIIWGYGYN